VRADRRAGARLAQAVAGALPPFHGGCVILGVPVEPAGNTRSGANPFPKELAVLP
jgi:hypothetical protein